MTDQADTKRREFRFLPLSLRLETLGGVATPLVLRGTPLPATRAETFSTAEDNQPTVELTILFGERPLAVKNIRLGKFQLTGIPLMPRGKPEIRVLITVDQSCKVSAQASLDGTPLQASSDLEPLSKYLKDTFLAKVKANAAACKDEDDREVSLIEARNRAESLIYQAEKRLTEHATKKSAGLDMDAVSKGIASLGQALEAGDIERMREATGALQANLSPEQRFDSNLFTQPIFESIFGRAPTGQPFTSTQSRRPASKPRSHSANEPGRDVAQRVSPQFELGRIFGGGTFTLDPGLCFVLMPFKPTFQPIYETHIRPVVQRAGLISQRADEIRGTSLITRDIWEKVNRARFLIADLTG